MKYAFILTQLELGGAQVRVFQTAAELRSRGHEVDVFFLYRKRSAFDDEPKIILSSRSGIFAIIQASVVLLSKLKAGKYDGVFTNTAPANIVGNFCAMLLGMKNRVAVQTQPPQRLNKIYRLIDKVWGTAGIYRTNVANSRWTFSCFSRYPENYKRRIKIVMDGITPRVSQETKHDARVRLGMDPAAKIIVNVGRLSTQKGQSELIASLPNIPAAQLYIAGDGELKQALSSLAADLDISNRVHFLGEIPGDKLALLLRASDVFVFTSRWETFGLAAVEAAASELPIVANDLDVLREVLSTDDGEPAAIFVRTEDIQSLSQEISRLISDPDLCARYSVLSSKVAHRHSMKRHADSLLALIH